MPHITPGLIFKASLYWNFFWNGVYIFSPPREFFNSPRYNKFLDLVSYYGGLNIRSLVMKAYGARPSDAPPIPAQPDPPAAPKGGKDV